MMKSIKAMRTSPQWGTGHPTWFEVCDETDETAMKRPAHLVAPLEALDDKHEVCD